MSELKPCPFCGGKAQRITITDEAEFANVGGDIITCTKCDCSTRVFFGEKEGIEDAWNRRIAALPPITAETVRRVLDAMGGLIGSGTKPDDWLNHEAIAQRANQEDECADEHCNAKAACVNELAGLPCRVRN